MTPTKTGDELCEQIITAGLAENDFILDLNGNRLEDVRNRTLSAATVPQRMVQWESAGFPETRLAC